MLVSACLIGEKVRYDGKDCFQQKIFQLYAEEEIIPVCPEVLGGLSIPREPAEIIGGDGEDVLDGKAKVMTKTGRDVTKSFIDGAYQTLKRVKEAGAEVVILKEYSPTCGSQMIYNGEFSGKKIAGMGVTCALLKRHGIKVISEEELNIKD